MFKVIKVIPADIAKYTNCTITTYPTVVPDFPR